MWKAEPFAEQTPSFLEPVVPPLPGPFDWPRSQFEINTSWIPYLLGGAMQLIQPTTWIVPDQAALYDILGRVTDLLAVIGNGDTAMQIGTLAVTIPAGSAVGTLTVVFAHAFVGTPVVVVSEDTGLYIASAGSPTNLAFTATLTAATPVIADSTANLSFYAKVP